MAKQYSVTVNGVVYDVTVEEVGAVSVAAPVQTPAQTAPVAPAQAPSVSAAAPAPAPAPAAPAPTASGDGEPVNAPLNGTVLKINVQNGASVKSGDVLCVLEAMKMENDIVAPRDGKITSVGVSQGATVNPGDVLFTIA